ncbi:hypothetical protein MKW92_002419 [Papaver armeniacum]|nr:hypothetical protein MKW92_002419 [Papaver armeniacum]
MGMFRLSCVRPDPGGECDGYSETESEDGSIGCFSCVRPIKDRSEPGFCEDYGSESEAGKIYLSEAERRNASEQAAQSDSCIAKAHVFKLTELIDATNRFNPDRVIGEGSLGRGYKGVLEDGQEVAVKRFNKQVDLLAELRILSCIEHFNIIKMIGYCDIGKEHYIVYEYMKERSLNLHLHDLPPGNKSLDWKTRMKIAEGVAKALEYLHNKKLPPIIYGGLKTTGILLDENYNPKLSDFSCINHVARSGYTGEHEKLPYGYIATELFFTSRVSFKSDVYSFGVVLLELISGRKAIDRTRTSGEICMALWARRLLRSKKFKEIADPLMKGQYPYRGLVQALGLVEICIHRNPNKRPPIAEVVTTLLKIASQIYEEERGTTEATVQRKLVNVLQPCCRTQVVG